MLDEISLNNRYISIGRMMQLGIPYSVYTSMLEQSGGGCSICNRTTVKLCIDHDHKNGRIRMLLCRRCNFLVGFIEKGGIELVKRAISYVEHHQDPNNCLDVIIRKKVKKSKDHLLEKGA